MAAVNLGIADHGFIDPRLRGIAPRPYSKTK